MTTGLLWRWKTIWEDFN